MNEARWYPTLTTMSDGKILSLSGLDEIGQLVPGKNEVFDPKTKKWTYTKGIRQFPTYPGDLPDAERQECSTRARTRATDGQTWGRDPGIWDVATDKLAKSLRPEQRQR